MDIFSKNDRSRIMSAVKNKDSAIEIKIRKDLWGLGFRYRKNSNKYFGKPDLVLARYKTVIFTDSCFWHGCGIHGSIPKTNKKFWQDKIGRNVERDIEVNKKYKEQDWKVIRIWEHDIKDKPNSAVKKLKKNLF